MRQHHALPHVHFLMPRVARSRTTSPAEVRQRRQRFKDQIAVAAVLILILATAAVIVSYVAHEMPRWRAGEIGNFEPTPVPAATLVPVKSDRQAAASPASALTGLGRVPLILISTVVEMAIFLALGLYFRHDANRKP